METENTIYEIDGNMGSTLKVYEDRCVISVSGVKAVLFGTALNGDKEFYYSDITSVQFKNLGVTTGYLQFEFAGSHSKNNYLSENSFTFSATIGTAKYKRLKEEMIPVYEYIQSKVRSMKELKNYQSRGDVSIADELIKFKELLDNGIISQEEFDKKKKQLLEM
jgi:hypothetical protein